MAGSRLGQRLRRLVLADGGLPIVWVALTVLALYPVWRARLLPMLDLPNHLSLARGWHDYHDPASRVAEFYELRVKIEPYILFYGAIHYLLYLVPIEVANKLFLSAYLILFPLSVLAVARAFRRSGWLALFAFPLCFNQNWIYGFASYLMSLTFALFALAALVRYLDTGRLRWALALGAACVVSYLGHIMPWFLFGVCALGLLGLRWRQWPRVVVGAVVMLPSLTMAILVILDEQTDKSYIKGSSFVGTFRDFPTSVIEFPRRCMEIIPGNFDAFVLALLVATLVGLFVWARLRPDPSAREPEHMRMLRLCLWLLGLCYISLPYSITKPMSWWYVAPRIPSLMLVLFALLPPVRLQGLRRLALLPVVVAGIILPLKLAKLYRNFSARNVPMMKLIEETPRGALTLVVVRNMMRGTGSEEKSGDPVTSAPVYWHFSSWPMALKGGYSPYQFDQGIPLRPKNPIAAPPWGSTDSFAFRQAPDFEYYIVRDAIDEMDREPSVQLVKRTGDWSLYKRIHPMSEEP